MSTLTKIRNRAGLLVGIIAFALLAFILGDVFRSGTSMFGSNPTEVGKIGNRSVGIEEFEARLEQAKNNTKEQQKKAELDENTIEMLRNQTWNQLVYETIMKNQYEELGINVGSAELFDMVQGKNPHPNVVQAFTDPKTGQFTPGAVINFLKNLDQNQETKVRWLEFEKGIKAERLSNKYNTLVKNGLYVTKAQARANYVEMNRNAKFQYVAKKYMEVPDSLYKVEESDLKNYYNQNKNKFKQAENARSFDYVAFKAIPSADDQKAAMDDITKIAEEFKTTKEDSAFIAANTDGEVKFAYSKKGTLAPALDTVMFGASIGYVYGPYTEGSTYKVAKLIDARPYPDSVKARHILIKPINGDLIKAKAKVDSLKTLVKEGKVKFEQLAMMVSEDEGSKIKGGDLGWFKEGQMVPSFNDACFKGKKGDMPVVESQFGVHFIEIMDKGVETKRIEVGVIERQVHPSNKTYQSFYAKASEFAGKGTTAESFDKAIVDGGLNKRIAADIKELDKNLPGVTGARELVKWAYQAKKDDISPVFEADGNYIIAKLTAVKDKGTLPLEVVKEQVEAEARKEKKAEQYIKEMEGAATLEALATKLKTTPMSADNTNFGAGFIPGLGREVEVTGYVFTAKKGQLSKPIKGENGVYVVKLEDIIEAKPSTDNYKSNLDQLIQQYKQRADYELFDALKEKANIIDNRAKFM